MAAYEINNLDELIGIQKAKRNALQPQTNTYRLLITGKSGTGKTNSLVSLLTNGFLPFQRLIVVSKSLEQPLYKYLRYMVYLAEESRRKSLEKKLGPDIKELSEEQLNMLVKVGVFLDSLDELEKLFNYSKPASKEEKKPFDLSQLRNKNIKEAIDAFTAEEDDPVPNIPIEAGIDRKFHTLIVLDDLLCEKDQTIIDNIFVRGRPRNISAIYLTQSYYDVHKIIRKQCNLFMFFTADNKRDMVEVAKDHATIQSSKEFIDMFNEAVSDGHSFLYIDKTQTVLPLMYRKNVNGLLIA